MAKCPHCGAHVGEYAYTCIKCGNMITNGSDKEFEIKRTVSVPTPGASRRRRRPGMNANAENKSNIEAIRAMLSGANEEKSETEPVIENAPVIEEPVVIKEEPVFVEPIVEEAPVIEEPIFVEPE